MGKEGLFLIVSGSGVIEKIVSEITSKKGIVEEWRICQKKYSDENNDCKIFKIEGEEPDIWRSMIAEKQKPFSLKLR